MNHEDPIDALLRSHCAGRLDRQRGRAVTAFEDAIARPASLSFAKAEKRRPLRTASGIGLALAASVALGITVPTIFSRLNSPSGDSIGTRSPGTVNTNSVRSNEVRNSYSVTEDGGPVMINPTTPGRVMVRRQIEQIRWRDVAGNDHVEYITPGEQRTVVEQLKQ